MKKSESEFFNEVIQKLGLKPEELMYWDDDNANVEVAKSVGICAFTYTNFDSLYDTVTNNLKLLNK